jgi:prophage regulatory protein
MREQLHGYIAEGEKRLEREALAQPAKIGSADAAQSSRGPGFDSAEAARSHYRRLLDADDLRALGIRYSRVHLHRLVQAQKFPAPIKLGLNRNAWVASEIHAWIDARIRERDTADAK